MGEEDAAALRADAALCSLALRLCNEYGAAGAEVSRAGFLDDVDRGLEPSRGAGERVWVLDPIDGTKGFMTAQGYVIGLALLVDGEPLVGVMGAPTEEECPPIMVAAKGHGLKWYSSSGAAVEREEARAPAWLGSRPPPWLLSPSSFYPECAPFGPEAAPRRKCCGSMVKYFEVAAGRAVGFVQYECRAKSWDHACGAICVMESGGTAADGAGEPLRFRDRAFETAGGIVCTSRWADDEARRQLRESVPTLHLDLPV